MFRQMYINFRPKNKLITYFTVKSNFLVSKCHFFTVLNVFLTSFVCNLSYHSFPVPVFKSVNFLISWIKQDSNCGCGCVWECLTRFTCYVIFLKAIISIFVLCERISWRCTSVARFKISFFCENRKAFILKYFCT